MSARAVIGQSVTALDEREAIIGALQERTDHLEAENAHLRGEDLRTALGSSLGENARLREEQQRLRAALAQAKGEQGQPRVLPKRQAAHPSEQGRGRPPRAWRKRGEVADLPIGRALACHLAPEAWPADARPERYLGRTVQDLVLLRDNVRIRRAQYAAVSAGQPDTAPLPVGYRSAEISSFILLHRGIASKPPLVSCGVGDGTHPHNPLAPPAHRPYYVTNVLLSTAGERRWGASSIGSCGARAC